jgi:hypothetical protein
MDSAARRPVTTEASPGPASIRRCRRPGWRRGRPNSAGGGSAIGERAFPLRAHLRDHVTCHGPPVVMHLAGRSGRCRFGPTRTIRSETEVSDPSITIACRAGSLVTWTPNRANQVGVAQRGQVLGEGAHEAGHPVRDVGGAGGFGHHVQPHLLHLIGVLARDRTDQALPSCRSGSRARRCCPARRPRSGGSTPRGSRVREQPFRRVQGHFSGRIAAPAESSCPPSSSPHQDSRPAPPSVSRGRPSRSSAHHHASSAGLRPPIINRTVDFSQSSD